MHKKINFATDHFTFPSHDNLYQSTFQEILFKIEAEDGRNFSRNVAPLQTFIHNMINMLQDDHKTSKQKYFLCNKAYQIGTC